MRCRTIGLKVRIMDLCLFLLGYRTAAIVRELGRWLNSYNDSRYGDLNFDFTEYLQDTPWRVKILSIPLKQDVSRRAINPSIFTDIVLCRKHMSSHCRRTKNMIELGEPHLLNYWMTMELKGTSPGPPSPWLPRVSVLVATREHCAGSCVIQRQIEWYFRLRMVFSTKSTVWGSSALVGSKLISTKGWNQVPSSKRTEGLQERAMARLILWASPPDKVFHSLSQSSKGMAHLA